LISKPHIGITVLALCLVLDMPVASSKEQGAWVTYENSSFIVYSNGSPKKVRRLLRRLALYRTAVSQSLQLKIPLSADKTVVLIPRSKSEYRKMVPMRSTAGVAYSDGKNTLLVLPISTSFTDQQSTIGHEYAHAVLNSLDIRFPDWYNEGFAELVGSIEIEKDESTFNIGKPIDRAYDIAYSVDWDRLISPEFDVHRIKSLHVASTAYTQAWLLAHYVTVGEERLSARDLHAFLVESRQADSMVAIFEETFEMTPDEFWKKKLRPYSRHLPNYQIRLRSALADTNFTESPADLRDVNWLTVFLLSGSKVKPAKDVEIGTVGGVWGRVRIGDPCDPVLTVTVKEDRQYLDISDFHRFSDGSRQTAFFQWRAEEGGDYILTERSGQAIFGTEEEIGMRFRDQNTMCLFRPGSAERLCTEIIARCPE
jgi:hypothetical protein